MKILFLAHRIPYPPNKGEKLRAYHELRFLAARHTVDLFCFADSPAEAEKKEALRPLCGRVYVETLSRTRAGLRAAWGLGVGQPFSLAYFDSPSFRAVVEQALAQESYDVILVYCSSMAQYVPRESTVPVVIDFVDIDSAKWAQYAAFSSFPISWLYAREARLLAQYEKQVAASVYASVVATSQEAVQLDPHGRLSVVTVCNGVRLPPPLDASELPDEVRRSQPYALFVGQMDYRPNVDAVIYFAREILPLIRTSHPALRFLIVGRNPTRTVQALAKDASVVVTGEVPDIHPYLSGALAAVAPFRMSQGVQNKILEALALGVPVVTTPRPARAIGARQGETLLIAETPETFAQAVISLLEDPALRRSFRHTPDFVREHYDWDRNLSRLESLLQDAAGVPQEMELAVGVPDDRRAG